MTQINLYGQEIGEPIDDWQERPEPGSPVLKGRFCQVERLSPDAHAQDLYMAHNTATDGRLWTYMSTGPFNQFALYLNYINELVAQPEVKCFAVIDLSLNKTVGSFALMRIDTKNGVVEVGNVAFSPLLRQKTASTEAQFLLMSYVFDTLGYRRYEWKCDSLNTPSRQAALRLGFQFEGIFRQAVVYKGRSRDTAWYSLLDKEWPQLKTAFQQWLAQENFDNNGNQIKTLSDIKKQLQT